MDVDSRKLSQACFYLSFTPIGTCGMAWPAQLRPKTPVQRKVAAFWSQNKNWRWMQNNATGNQTTIPIPCSDFISILCKWMHMNANEWIAIWTSNNFNNCCWIGWVLCQGPVLVELPLGPPLPGVWVSSQPRRLCFHPWVTGRQQNCTAGLCPLAYAQDSKEK